MAVLEDIRKKGGIIVSIVIGLALFAFVLGDFISPGAGRVRNLDVAKINGQVFSVQKLETKIDEVSNMYQQQFGQLDDRMRDMVHEQAWQMFLSETLMQQAYSKIGLTVSPEELWDWINGPNPPMMIRREFTNAQGEFDRSFLRNFLNRKNEDPNAEAGWIFLENRLIEERFIEKYNALVGNGIYVPDFMAENENQEINRRIDFDYIAQNHFSIHDSLITVSNNDIKEYYKKHQKQWEQTASRDIEYVVFNIVPSDEDHAAAQQWIERIKPEFEAAADPFQFIRLQRRMTADQRFKTRDQLPVQVTDLFDEPVGTVVGPYQEADIWKLVRLVNVENRPDSIKLNQIFLMPKAQTQASYIEVIALADSIKTAIEGGAHFAPLAVKYSADPSAAINSGDQGWVHEQDLPSGSPMEEVFSLKRGEVLKTETGNHVIITQVAERGRESKKVQIAILQNEITFSSRTEQIVYAQASKFAIENRSEKQFDEAAIQQNLNKRIASNLGENSRQIPGLTSARQIVRWAFEAKRGQVSDVFTIDNSYVVAVLKNVRKDGFASIDDVKTEIEMNIRRERKGELIASQLSEVAQNVQSFSELASNLNLPVETANGITFSSFSIPGAGIEPKLIGAVTVVDEGNISKPVEGFNGVFLFTVKQITEPEYIGAVQAKERLTMTYFNRSRIDQGGSGMLNSNSETLQAIRKASKIDDLRSKFY